MERKTKAETFIGFILRAKKYRVGLNSIASIKRANLIIVCRSAAENTINEGVSFAKKFHCPLIKTKERLLEDFINRPNAKVMAVTDKALAKALLDNIENDFVSVEQER
ncbi:MAG: hypothetical protein IJZ73_04015 [Clostridia bacterium]|nr:hypothetical protein [Clostridia bacterium]